jgi:diguanylate cyclase (GGDEF)-like protein/putative nucleotidyltransferase with HDIG domain/PAS domain S-box-containing protein
MKGRSRPLVLRISLSLGAVSFASVVLCVQIGLLPDAQTSQRQARSQLCETLGASLSLGPIQKGPQATRQYLELFAARNKQATSLGLREAQGRVVAQIGDHLAEWERVSVAHPELCFVVPIIRGKQVWGRLEIVFAGETGALLPSYVPSWSGPALAVGFSVFALAWFTLSRILKHLDPSRVVPARVRETLDTFAEGVLLLDRDERIVLANRAFADNIGASSESLTGRFARDLGWQPASTENGNVLPWQTVTRTDDAVHSATLQLDSARGLQHYCVNAVPVRDDAGKLRGTMAAFANVTELERKKGALAKAMEQLSASHADIARKNEELEFLATRDPLTGCLNRRSLFERFEQTWDLAARGGRGLACIMIDIDFFKSVNDNYGHQKGDEVLRATGGLLAEMAREGDLPTRYGGEEFCMVLADTSLDEAISFAEQLRERLGRLDFGVLKITASLGVSSIDLGAADPQAMIDQADKCLYVAKRNGRNQTVSFDRVAANLVVDESQISRTASPNPAVTPADRQVLSFRCVAALLSTLAYRDPATAAHSLRVADLSFAIGRKLLSPRDAYHVEVAALLHDIGKIGVPDSILLKPGPLNDEEWAVMRRHDRFGVEIVNASFGFEPVTEIVRHHHARYGRDGKDALPLGARIVTIADAFDAMTNDRPYRDAQSIADACAELRRCAGKQFDPELVELFCEVVQGDFCTVRCRSGQLSQEIALSVGQQLEELVAAFEAEDGSALASLSQRLSLTARQSRIDELADTAEELSRLAEDDAEMADIVESVHELLKLGSALHAHVLETVAASYE